MPRDDVAVPSAEKALHLLAAFEREPRWSLHAIAGAAGLPKSTAHRLLASLKVLDFVRQDHRDGCYVLGPRVYALVRRAQDDDGLVQLGMDALRRLVAETGETALMTVQRGLHAHCIARVNTPQELALTIQVGHASPLHLGGSNTPLLAFLPVKERSAILMQTVHAPAERRRAEREMQQIVARGYSYSASQLTPGAAAIGVPVWGVDGRVAACLSIGAPAFRFPLERAQKAFPALRRAADVLSRRLGYAEAHGLGA